MATGGTSTITGNAAGTNYADAFTQTATPGTGGLMTVFVSNRSTSAGPAFVYATEIHDSAAPVRLNPGDLQYFRFSYGSSSKIQIKGDGTNAATVDFGIVSKN